MQIVIVDPSRVVLMMVAASLEQRGYVVHRFTDSAEALRFLTETPSVHILITSLQALPLSGLELCWSARLLADGRRPLYVIAMSSVRDARSLAEALDSGADDFIDKPPSREELHARLRVAERLVTLQEHLIQLAETDSLSGLLNRRAFIARARADTDRLGEGSGMAMILADIDFFKRINDEHGHDIGDRAIQAMASAMAEEGAAGRLGGEEFALALPGADPEAARAAAERLCQHARALRIRGARGALVRFTCSFGVSVWAPGDTVETLMKRADVALYTAKGSGRDRVVMSADAQILAEAG